MILQSAAIMLDKVGGCSSGRIRSLTGGILVNLCLVHLLTLGNLSTYVTSYILYVNPNTTIENEDIGWVMLYGVASGSFGSVLGALVERPLKSRMSTFLGCCTYVAGVLLSYFSIQSSFYLFICTYGVICTMGAFWAFAACAQNVIQWVPNHPSTVTGAVAVSGAFGSLLFDMTMTAYINPENLPASYMAADGNMYFTDKTLLTRVPGVFLVLGGTNAAIMFAGFLLMSDVENQQTIIIDEDKELVLPKNDDEDEERILGNSSVADEGIELQTTSLTSHTERYGATDVTSEREENDPIDDKYNQKREAQRDTEDTSLRHVVTHVLTQRDTYIIWAYTTMVSVGMTFTLNQYKVYGQTFISDDVFLAFVGSMGGIVTNIARPFWGILMDKCGLEMAMKVIAALVTIMLGTLGLTVYIGKTAYLVWIFGLFTSFGGIETLITGGLSKLYGNKNVLVVFSIFNTAVIVATFVSTKTTILLVESIGWNGVFTFITSLAVFAFFITYPLAGKDKKVTTG